MFDVKYTSRFKKDYKRLKKRGYDMDTATATSSRTGF